MYSKLPVVPDCLNIRMPSPLTRLDSIYWHEGLVCKLMVSGLLPLHYIHTYDNKEPSSCLIIGLLLGDCCEKALM